MSYSRYSRFKGDGTIKVLPSIKITVKGTDFYEVYERGKTKLNNLSYEYYKDPNYDWLIMLANPELGSLEFNIPDGSIIRIPYPLENTLQDYEQQVNNYNVLYGIN